MLLIGVRHRSLMKFSLAESNLYQEIQPAKRKSSNRNTFNFHLRVTAPYPYSAHSLSVVYGVGGINMSSGPPLTPFGSALAGALGSVFSNA